MALPSFTSTWHTNTYASISPTRPELSAAGKTIVVTGGGSGIGARIAASFAQAGATKIHILGRRGTLLQSVKASIEAKFPKTTVGVHVADVLSPSSLQEAALSIGQWSVLVANAGYLSSRHSITTSPVDEWWRSFEINIKGTFLTLQAFTPSARLEDHPVVIGMSTMLVNFSPEWARMSSAYVGSKMGLLKVLEIYGAENEAVRVVGLHPGAIETDLLKKAQLGEVALDNISLPGDFSVWVASEEATFTGGRLLWCNWDVDELKARAKDIEADPLLLTSTTGGWPYTALT